MRRAILRGAQLAADRQIELAMFQAYYTGRIATFTEKLEPLGKYLETLKPAKPRRRQSSEEMLAAMRAIKASTSINGKR